MDYINHYKTDAIEFDYFEERIGATKDDERRVHEYIISKIPKDVKEILDVGAGSGWVANHFKNKSVKVVSVDIAKKNILKINQNIDRNYGIVSDSLNLAVKKNTFDCIIASEIIEHVIDPKKFVNQLFEKLNNNGKLFITTPYKEKLKYYLCVHCNNKTPANAHLHSFDETKLISLCGDKDLAKIKWFTFGNKLLIFLRTYVILRYLPFPVWRLTDSLFNMIKSIPAHILVEYSKKN